MSEFKALRLTNWAIGLLMIGSYAAMVIKAPTLIGVLISLAFAGLVAATFIFAAVLLARSPVFFGVPIAAYTERLRKVSVVCNWIFCIFSGGGVVACIVTSQIGPMVVLALFFALSFFNIRALRTLKAE